MIDWSLFLLCGTSLVFLHYYNLFLLCIVSIPVLYGRRRHFHTTLPCFVATAMAIAIPFALWSPTFVRQLSSWSAPDVLWWKHAIFFPVYVVGGRTFVWKHDGLVLLAVGWLLVLAAVLIPVIWGLRKSPKSIGIPLAIGVGMPAVAVAMSILKDPMLNCRYLAPVIPCLIVAATVSIWWLSRRHPYVGALAMTTAFVIPMISLPRMYLEQQKDDWRNAAQFISQNASSDLVAFNMDIGVVPYRYYDRDVRALPLKMDFTPGLSTPAMENYLQILSRSANFWVVHWLPSPKDDLPPTQQWLERHFQQVEEQTFRGLTVQRWQVDASNPSK